MNESSEAAPKPMRSDAIAGEFVTETFNYDGGRQVTVYIPPDPPEAIVFAGDGQMIARWGGFLEAADVPSTMIVGAHRVADETKRLHEYRPASIRHGFPHTSGSSSRTSVRGHGHVSR